ncbi:MAG: hypothetical protein CLLPBCKN_007362 [Chroococcidiopsis cubana SAG 39.79]|uniref:Uncharacterized protein n=1 Tax=Chroococcidiopsis cubana SAG 39.79 TaxID=388085 RepID=A0AB37US21_9CYAN|nr:hypothetical protein [Chroococcidiopsis cubana]MDZ4877927.1 hypothetical protein [Chroococcidiopsis cubana SAG 39.79]PSB66358.1 hypothetical protein C7B79_01515 [Chroococcidiopsis cubana CCALA 043]RUT14192.1 hypothetical protein DSM107010_06750 [Chroococcidiopsis cubana SAG 39.79]
MPPPQITTLIGGLAAIAQIILAQLIYWEYSQKNLSISTAKHLPVSERTISKLELTDCLFSPARVWSLGLLTLVLYGLLGFHFAVVGARLWVWALAVLINYWNLANLRQRRFSTRHKNYLVKALLAAHIMPSAVAIAGIVWASIQNLPIYLPVALGLATGINSVVMMAMFTELFGRSKAVTLVTGVSYLGFVLGFILQQVSL